MATTSGATGPIPPTGAQHVLTSGRTRAIVTEQGATLRSLQVNGADLVHGFPETVTVTGGRGQNLLPWPNRIRDGAYTFDGVRQQLPLSEPAKHNASHGLVRWVLWTVVEQTDDLLRSQVRVLTQPGYPAALEATLTHQVDDEGLRVTVAVRNIGSVRAPFGYGAHPYLTVGEDVVDDVTVTVPAATYLQVDERSLPSALASVDGTPLDLRPGRRIGDQVIDTAFTDLTRDDDRRWRVRLQGRDRATVLWADEQFSWTQVFTGGPHRDGGVAVEPMTCGPDAFNEGPTAAARIVLAPGEAFHGVWGISTEPS